MVNDEDVARLRQGVAAWNAWRVQNPEARVDLRQAGLTGARLVGTNLSGARSDLAALEGAYLSETVFADVDAAIRVRDKLLLILSKNAIASDWVEDEVGKAFAEERPVTRSCCFPSASTRR